MGTANSLFQGPGKSDVITGTGIHGRKKIEKWEQDCDLTKTIEMGIVLVQNLDWEMGLGPLVMFHFSTAVYMNKKRRAYNVAVNIIIYPETTQTKDALYNYFV